MNYVATWIKQSTVKLVGIADLHLGSPCCERARLEKVINKADEYTYFLLLGDILDNAIVDSVSDVYTQTMNPEQALAEFARLLDLLAGKVLGVVSGNHERRTKKHVGVDIIKLLCEERSIPYSNDILVIDLAAGENTSRGSRRRVQYTIVCGHGYSAARGIGAKITGNGRLIDVVANGDVYLTAHTHQPSVVKFARFEVDTRNKQLFRREAYLVTVPAWIGYEEYAAEKFMHPSAGGYVEVELSGREKRVEIRVI